MSFYASVTLVKIYSQINFQKEVTYHPNRDFVFQFNSSRICKQCNKNPSLIFFVMWSIFLTFLMASLPNYAVSKF